MPNNPIPPLVGGNQITDVALQNFVFQSGIHKPKF